MDEFQGLIAGIYATSPNVYSWNESTEREYFSSIKESVPHLRGLELPFWGESLHPYNDEFLLREFSSNWVAAMTCIPATMKGLQQDSSFGLASKDCNGREKAVETHKRASEAVQKINDHFGKQIVKWVQVGSGPAQSTKNQSSLKEQFLRSLEELTQFSWDGATLCIEHCDSGKNATSPVKGFLSLEEEVWALNRLGSDLDIGITLNWGRSAIEGRSTLTPLEHIELCRESGFLKGFIFSGTSAEVKSAYGPWKDNHAPFACEKLADFGEKTSLLSLAEARRCLKAMGGACDYVGFKVLHEPMQGSSLSQRVGVNIDAARVLHHLMTQKDF